MTEPFPGFGAFAVSSGLGEVVDQRGRELRSAVSRQPVFGLVRYDERRFGAFSGRCGRRDDLQGAFGQHVVLHASRVEQEVVDDLRALRRHRAHLAHGVSCLGLARGGDLHQRHVDAATLAAAGQLGVEVLQPDRGTELDEREAGGERGLT
jgi:hypothetical protein